MKNKIHAIKNRNLSIKRLNHRVAAIAVALLGTTLPIWSSNLIASSWYDSHYIDLNRLITAESWSNCSFYEVCACATAKFIHFKCCCNAMRINSWTYGPFLLIIQIVPDLSVTFQHKSNVYKLAKLLKFDTNRPRLGTDRSTNSNRCHWEYHSNWQQRRVPSQRHRRLQSIFLLHRIFSNINAF